jgi:hypothetical protein
MFRRYRTDRSPSLELTLLSDPVNVLAKILVMASENASELYFLGCLAPNQHIV